MKKIESYLTQRGLKLKLIESDCLKEHYGGRSFDNDGTYLVDEYEIVDSKRSLLDKKYEIQHKKTGRPLFRFYVNGVLHSLETSQKGFINRILEQEFKKKENTND